MRSLAAKHGARAVLALRAFDEILRTIAYAGEEPVLQEAVPLVRELLESEQAIAYRMFPSERAAFELDFAFTAGMGPTERVRKVAEPFLARARGPVTLYRIPTPRPEERNVIHWAKTPEERRTYEAAPIVRGLYPALGLAGQDQIRVVLCDGPHLLAWLGAFRLERYGEREAERLALVVEPLVRRLRLEERLRQLGLRSTALDVALEALGVPAFLIDHRGRVAHANTAGRSLLADERRALVERAKGPGADPRFQLWRIQADGLPPHHLLVASPKRAVERKLAAFVQRWKLSSRQVEVLLALLEGKPNKQIAAELGVREGTVEFHVTGLLRKVDATNRSELAAIFWSDDAEP